jgi:hypothetical protein
VRVPLPSDAGKVTDSVVGSLPTCVGAGTASGAPAGSSTCTVAVLGSTESLKVNTTVAGAAASTWSGRGEVVTRLACAEAGAARPSRARLPSNATVTSAANPRQI